MSGSTQDTQKSARSIHSPGTYSILLLFYLTSLAAIIVAACRMAIENSQITGRAFATGAVVLGFLGFIVGSILGFCIGRNAVAVTIGALAAACFGPVATGLAVVSATQFASLNMLILVGCWFIILIAIIANRMQSR